MTGILLLAAALTNITGVVTFERAGLPFFFIDEPSGAHWRVERAEGVKLAVGDRVEVTGERELTVKPRLAETSVSVVAHEPESVPPPRRMSPGELFSKLLPIGNTDLYGGVFESEGILRDINRRQKTTQLLVGEGDANIQVELPWALEDRLPDTFVPGARVKVTGVLTYTSIENFEEGVFGRIENIELIPRGAESVEVVRRAPFWTVERLTYLIRMALIVTFALLVWAITLRRMVAKRTRELAESIRERERAAIEENAARHERLRLAADLHDGFQQYLASAMFRLKAAQNYLSGENPQCREQLDKVKDALQHTQNGLRATLWAMNEESEGPESILQLFAFVSRRMVHWEGIVEISSEGEERKMPHTFAGKLLLVLQEAVGNAIHHGQAKRVRVKAAFTASAFVLTVSDDGVGFDASTARAAGHYGITGMERRAADLGGTFDIVSAPGKGTTLTVTVPL